MSTVAVLGAAGATGPAIVRHLVECGEVDDVALLDVAAERAEAIARAHGRGRATAAVVDGGDPDDLGDALRRAGASVLVNAAPYRLNLAAMTGALDADCHYVDLGGLYDTTLRQADLHGQFAAAGLTAVLGVGASPGTTNLLAVRAAAELDRVDALHVAAAAADPEPARGLSTPDAVETILDQLTLPAVVVRGGRAGELPPRADGGEVVFPEPVGPRRAVYARHCGLATFPASFPGLRASSFRLALAPVQARRLGLLVRCGLADPDPVRLADGTWAVPRSVLTACLDRAGAAGP
ncbi:MAG TPA: saccharopine dehydrogenase NADP-binding domain-containing protein, partial [Acidimicrobiales bacterium]